MDRSWLLASASDCITRFRSSMHPLKNVVADVIASRRLNSHKRRELFDLVFRFSKESILINAFIAKAIPFSSSMSVQERDTFALKLLLAERDSELGRAYEQWLSALGNEQYFLALGELGSLIKRDYGALALDIVKSLRERSLKYLAFDRRRLSLNDLSAALSELNIKHFSHDMLPTALAIVDEINILLLPSHIRDHIWFMDAGSQVIAELIKPKSNETVLDICTGLGNKAKYIAMHDVALTAMDIDKSRLAQAKKRLPPNVCLIEADARASGLPKNHFDWILLDAPCSGTGVLRRQPDSIFRFTKNMVEEYVALQRALLHSALSLLKPNGVLIYATCSLLKAENIEQIKRLLKEQAQAFSVDLRVLGGDRIRFKDQDDTSHGLTLLPHLHACDGFFVAALSKKA